MVIKHQASRACVPLRMLVEICSSWDKTEFSHTPRVIFQTKMSSAKEALACGVCGEMCKRGVSLPCCGAQACRACATKQVIEKIIIGSLLIWLDPKSKNMPKKCEFGSISNKIDKKKRKYNGN